MIIAAAVIAVSWFILKRTVLGLHIYSVGSNPEAARLSGIKVWKVLSSYMRCRACSPVSARS